MPLTGWSVLGVAHDLRGAQASRKGQAAVIFIVLIGLILLLASSTMNLGEVARLRTDTANAADAGALAGASWVASADNEVAMIARGMWLNQLIVQALIAFPFCLQACDLALQAYAALILTNTLLKVAANNTLHNAWDRAHATALFTAIQNTAIDDQSGTVSKQVKALSDGFEDSDTVPETVTLNWVRKGAGGVEEPSSVTFHVSFTSSQPKLEMGGWSPVFICWSPPFGTCGTPASCCWTTVGWGGGLVEIGAANPSELGAPAIPTDLGLQWIKVGKLKIWPKPGLCLTCVPIPFTLSGSGLTVPSDIANGQGEVTVTVSQHRAGGTSLGFWTMRYPDQIVSSATARYGGASVDLWPEADAKAELVAVQ